MQVSAFCEFSWAMRIASDVKSEAVLIQEYSFPEIVSKFWNAHICLFKVAVQINVLLRGRFSGRPDAITATNIWGTREDPNKEQLYAIIYCPSWLTYSTVHEYTFTAPA